MATITITGNQTENPLTNQFPVHIFNIFPTNIRYLLNDISYAKLNEIEEIRFRINRPIILAAGTQHFTINSQKELTENITAGYLVTSEDIERILHKVSQSSIYAWEEEFKRGYITLKGGHRIGLAGKVILDKGLIKTMKDISGLNFRIARQIIGVASPVLPYIIDSEQRIRHTLLVSPPQCGKTTLLRDIIRQLSTGIPKLGFTGVNIGLVDERSELAGSYGGIPQHDIGLRTDVLDGCPKAQGMIMLVRSMSPQVIATDEIGTTDDIQAIEEVLNAGISLLTTVHGRDINDLRLRPNLRKLLDQKLFSRIIILGRSQGVGTIEKVLDGKTLEILSLKSMGGRAV